MASAEETEPVEQVKKGTRNHWTEERVLILAALWEQGVDYKDICKETGMSKSAIQTYLRDHLTFNGRWKPFEPRERKKGKNSKKNPYGRNNPNIRDIEDVYKDSDLETKHYYSDPNKVPCRGEWNKKKSLDACLWYDEGVSTKEIAQRVGLSQQAVQKFVRNHKVKQGLWKAWQDMRHMYVRSYTGNCRKVAPKEDKTLIRTKYFKEAEE